MRFRTLMGIETEYAVSAMNGLNNVEPHSIFLELMQHVRSQHAHVSDPTAGVFLGNGARFYFDCGSHPEYATPECASPREVLAHIRAGERILTSAAQGVRARTTHCSDINVFRTNVDYRSTSSWGCHESYLHRSDPARLPAMLIPHLVSRIIFTGAGGFNPRSQGLEFTLSPRAWLMECAISASTTCSRGIFNTKDETLSSDGYHRLHLICGESLCSDLPVLLRLGTTALVVAAIDAGWYMGENMVLRDPVAALRAFAADPACRVRVPLDKGQPISAIELQRHYLERVQECRAQNLLPEWADEICQLWSDTLAALDYDARWAERMLDWGIKRSLYRHWAGGPTEWAALARWSRLWNQINNRLEKALKRLPETDSPPALDTLLGEHSPIPGEVAFLTRFLDSVGRDWDGVRQFLQRRQQLFEIDMRFGQLGEQGIHSQLVALGTLPTIVGDEDIERALTQPPATGRASVRGALIAEAHAAGKAASCLCDWTRMVNRLDKRYVDLRDPFQSAGKWQPDDNASLRQAFRHTLETFF